MLKILVLGTGYVGLVSGTCFAEMGHYVTCIDTDKKKIEGLKNGTKIPIYEKGLKDLIDKNKKNERLHFNTVISDYINDVDIVVIAVGTPLNAQGKTNFEYIDQCVNEILREAKKDLYVIMKSTVPLGTCDNIQKKFNEESKYSLHIISNPEFLREGEAVQDFLFPDRIVIGSDLKNNDIIENLYKKHRDNGVEIVYTNRVTAELIKYASNSFLASKVAFINEMSELSERLGGDINKVSYGMGLDKRIGNSFLNAGPGFGGSCFPKDIRALINISKKEGIDLPLLNAIEISNENRYQTIVAKINSVISKGDKIVVFGLTYKAGTDDVRCSPSINMIKELCKTHSNIHVHDPKGISKAKIELGNSVSYYEDLYLAAEDASLCIIMTEWDEYKNIDPKKLSKCMKKKSIYDFRKIINKEHFQDSGFKVMIVGYKSA